MSDLISRHDAIDAIARDIPFITFTEDPKRTAQRIIGTVPSAEPKAGEWIRNDNGTYSCCVCQSWIPEEQRGYARYCLYCGTRMVREDGE